MDAEMKVCTRCGGDLLSSELTPGTLVCETCGLVKRSRDEKDNKKRSGSVSSEEKV